MSTIVTVAKGQVVDLLEDRGIKGADMLDGMIEAQADKGQVVWLELRHHVAFGYAQDRAGEDNGKDRVAVFDLDGADGMAVIHVTNWVNGHTDNTPDLG
ncbi:hypothetical protein PBI_COOPER_87 [Mycobacterium phage Cooper]|uniref:Uncharacterized protein n=1 Tax=Mycobacterium phage Cooper TaxID=373406 RepID=Q1A029_9CAUD|nr:gp87 [Mycobacterium phage Cooper]ABD58204.1 hypothetical protein PBI_COOPER_87 [Mycobacterium phage Cooper]